MLTGDVLYAALADMRAQLAPQAIPTWEELTRLAAQIYALPPAAEIVWRPWEARCASPRSTRGFWTPSSAGYQIARIPLGEMLWVHWRDNGTAAPE